MTFAEIKRSVKSKARMMKYRNQERASYDYVLASLIIKGVSKVMGDKSEFPTLQQAYVGLFEDTEALEKQRLEAEQRKQELSVLRFKQFANFHNKKYEEVASDK